MRLSRRNAPLQVAAATVLIFSILYNSRFLGRIMSPKNDDPLLAPIYTRDGSDGKSTSDIPRRGGFPRWPAGEGVNFTTVLAWLDFAAMDARLRRKFNFDNSPTLPGVVLRNDERRYIFAISGPVSKTLPSAKAFTNWRIAPTESIFNEAINRFDGRLSINGLPLNRLYQLLDDGVSIPLALDLTDMKQCASSYSTHWGRGANEVHFFELPVWSNSIRVDCRHAFGLPDYGYIAALRRNASEWDAQFQVWDERYPWETKEKIAIWRGGASGTGWRQQMLEILHQSTLIDARVVDGQSNYRIPFEDFQKYRAVLDVDGNAWSERFPKLLCMNTPVVKVAPQFLGYRDFTAEPFVHYVPAPLNSSLIDLVNWTLQPKNNALVRRIVRNARAWCQEHMVRESAMGDLTFQLAAYVELLDQDSPGWTERAGKWRNGTVSSKLFPGLSDGRLRPLTLA